MDGVEHACSHVFFLLLFVSFSFLSHLDEFYRSLSQEEKETVSPGEKCDRYPIPHEFLHSTRILSITHSFLLLP